MGVPVAIQAPNLRLDLERYSRALPLRE